MNIIKSFSRCFGIATWQLTILLVLLSALSGYAETTWVTAGQVSGNWSAEHSPYMISEGDIEIAASDTLLIDAGVDVIFMGTFAFRVYGLLQAQGTSQDSIYFTCNPDSTPGGWRGIRFSDADDTSILRFCVVEQGRATGTFDLRYGGGVECQSCSPSFYDCTFRNNRATLDGGGVYLREGGTSRFERCLFEGNTANVGGGLLSRAQSHPVLVNCVFKQNSAPTAGGVMASQLSDMSVTNCQFIGNTSTIGGGFACDRNTSFPVVTNCSFVNNSADSSGSAVYLKGTGALLQHCIFYGNESDGIGGGTILADTVTAQIYNSIITGTLGGAGLQLKNASGLIVSGCDFYENAGGVYSGNPLPGLGVPSRLNLNFDSCDVFQNNFVNPRFINPATSDFHLAGNSPCIAGGVHIADAPADLAGNSRPLPLNTYPDQGLYERSEGSPVQLCGDLSGTIGPGEFAATCDLNIPHGSQLILERETTILFAGDFTLEVRGRLITNGEGEVPVILSRYFTDQTARWGGVEFMNAEDGCELNYTEIEYAHVASDAARVKGGGIYLENSGPVFNNCGIRNCESLLAISEGGGVYIGAGSDPIFNNCVIENNETALRGGGISVSNETSAVISGCEIRNNECGLFGGGVYLNQSVTSLEKCIITGNYSAGKGGGIYSWWSPAEISGCYILDNSCADAGGGLYVNNSTPLLMNCTVSGNHAVNGGGGLLLYQSSARVKNSIVSFSASSGIEFALNNAGALIEFTDVFGNQPGNYAGLENGPVNLNVVNTTNFNGDASDAFFNISSDPLFIDTTAGDFNISEGSLCINAGDPYSELDPDTSVADIGADYFPLAFVPPTAFNLISPRDGADVDETNLPLLWEHSFDEGTPDLVPLYRVQIALDPEFTNTALAQTLTDAALTVTTLADSTTYWWRAFAIGSNGIARSSNQKRSVYTVIPNLPTPFELLYPIDQDTLFTTESRLFCWEQSHDIDGGDFVVYSMHLQSFDTFAVYTDLADTCLNIVPLIQGFLHTGIVEWWVEASSNDPDTTIECVERFQFFALDTTTAIDEFMGVPTAYSLSANYPNPFNAVTNLSFNVPVESELTIKVLNVLGQEVAELVSERVQPGSHRVQWDANAFSSGLYLAVMQTGQERWITKMMLLK